MKADKLIILASVGGLLAALVSCTDAGKDSSPVGPTPPTQSDTISFSGYVLPTFVQYGCTGCHGGQNNLFVNSYSNLMLGNSDHGPVVIPFNSSGSILIQKLRGTASFGVRMPLGGPYLPSSTIDNIALWIDQGALDN